MPAGPFISLSYSTLTRRVESVNRYANFPFLLLAYLLRSNGDDRLKQPEGLGCLPALSTAVETLQSCIDAHDMPQDIFFAIETTLLQALHERGFRSTRQTNPLFRFFTMSMLRPFDDLMFGLPNNIKSTAAMMMSAIQVSIARNVVRSSNASEDIQVASEQLDKLTSASGLDKTSLLCDISNCRLQMFATGDTFC